MTSVDTNLQTDPFTLARDLSGKHFYAGEARERRARSSPSSTPRPASRWPKPPSARPPMSMPPCRRLCSAEGVEEGQRPRPGQAGGQVRQILAEHAEELARLIALETGKALRTESRVEASVLADAFTFFGGLGSELKGETVPFSPTIMTMTVREPIGIVGAILPWNVPLLLMALKIAALVAGNAVIVKSAEEAPLTVLRVVHLMNTVMPAGLVNILSGFGPECGAPLVSHPKVGKVTFTGSVETGKIVYKAAAEKLIPVTLELGGKSPMIVMEDADLDRAVAGGHRRHALHPPGPELHGRFPHLRP